MLSRRPDEWEERDKVITLGSQCMSSRVDVTCLATSFANTVVLHPSESPMKVLRIHRSVGKSPLGSVVEPARSALSAS